jgi:hypothetical protein
MSGELFGRAWLALDFIYCAVVGSIAIAMRARLGGLMRLPAILVAAVGAAVLGWGMLVLAQTVRIDWRTGVKQVLLANVAVAVLLAALAAFHPVRGARLLLAFVSLDVMSLAVVQSITLWRRGSHEVENE